MIQESWLMNKNTQTLAANDEFKQTAVKNRNHGLIWACSLFFSLCNLIYIIVIPV